MKRLVVVIIALASCLFAKAQIAIDTLTSDALNALLIEQIERMAEDSDEDLDYEDLLDNYIFYNCQTY